MISWRITVADVAQVTGFSRHKLRGLLRELPTFEKRREKARVAREYSRQDVVILAVCCELEERYCLKREAIATLIEKLRQTLSVPRTVATDARLVIRLTPPEVQYVDGVVPVADGIVVPLQPIFQRIDGHLEPDSLRTVGDQRSLDLGPVGPVGLKSNTRSGRARSSRSGSSASARGKRSGISR